MRWIRERLEEISRQVGVAPLGVTATTAHQVPHNLPRRLTRFIGRRQPMRDVIDLLRTNRLVSIVGMGGSGKTRLSVEAADVVLDEFVGGIWQVELSALREGARVVSTVRSTLGLDPGAKSDLDTVVEFLAGERALLLLDNCEHLRESVGEFLAAVLARVPELRVLATSRESLGVAGEHVFNLPALSTSDDDSEATELFLDRARAASALEVTNEVRASAAEICRRLDGIPLAIELAAARMRSSTIDDLTRDLDRALNVLAGGSHATLPRHQTLRGVIDWSYRQLGPGERSLFRRLSVFRGGWNGSSCAVVAGDEDGVTDSEIARHLRSLVEKSLVEVSQVSSDGEAPPEETRYRMLETVREFAAEHLARDSGEDAAAHRRLVTWAHELAAVLRDKTPKAKWLEWVQRDHENVLSALDWAARDETLTQRGLEAAVRLYQFWNIRGQMPVGRIALQKLLETGRGDVDTRLLAIRNLGNIHWQLGDYDEAQRLYETGLEIARGEDAAKHVASYLGNLGSVAMRKGDLAGALEFHQQSLLIHRQLGNKTGIATLLANVANVTIVKDRDFQTAHDLFAEALEIHVDNDDTHGIAYTLFNLGSACSEMNDFDRAEERFLEATRILKDLGDREVLPYVLRARGMVARERGAIEDALRFLRDSVDLRRKTGGRVGLAESLRTLGGILADAIRDLDAARTAIEESLQICREVGDARGTVESLWRLVNVEAAAGATEMARLVTGEAIARARSLDDRKVLADVAVSAAIVSATEGSDEMALRLLAAVDAHRANTGQLVNPSTRKAFDALVDQVRTRLGAAADAAWGAGAAGSLDDALDRWTRDSDESPDAAAIGPEDVD
ncbi:MAG: tetratricopeptide repeat protein [Candidatus Eisenbacteria bacterium]